MRVSSFRWGPIQSINSICFVVDFYINPEMLKVVNLELRFVDESVRGGNIDHGATTMATIDEPVTTDRLMETRN